MTLQQIQRHIRGTPFRPFALHLADGRALSVMHPELMLLSASGRTPDVYSTTFRVFETVDLLLIVSVRQFSDWELQAPVKR